MIPKSIKQNLLSDDKSIAQLNSSAFKLPKYDPLSYYRDIYQNDYFYALLNLRHYLKSASDYYFSNIQKAKNADLFILTPSIPSPAGPGSDSKPVPIKFGRLKTFLTDSSQFGLEPLLLIKNIKKIYCYLPSIRGEDYDDRHLNQFFHFEAEIVGTLDNLIPIIEDYIKQLCETILLMNNTVNKISDNPQKTKKILKKIIKLNKFPKITFDEAVDILIKNKKEKFINFTKNGRDINAKGEIELMKLLKLQSPLWVKYYDRDRVPFYQKPDPNNKDKTINADLLFPPLKPGAFGGEIVGSGQRQNNAKEIYESFKRQGISPKPYEWYIDLRRQPNYKTTSGFGLGIERFIAWALAKDNIRDVIFYPRLKNIISFP